ncbi:MAG: hypothetical protein HY000_39555 [Planctomycetes bacterium]|nr:hypothetical protein [Planctomycetota bacterium]
MTPLLAAGLLVYFVPAIACRAPVRNLIVRLIRPDVAGRLQIDSVHAGWFKPLEAQGVRYRSDRTELTADLVRSDRTLLDLIKTPTNWGHVQITAPRLTVETSGPASIVRSHTLATHPSSPVPAPAPVHDLVPAATTELAPKRNQDRPVTVEIEATHGTLTVVDRAAGTEWVARDLDFQLDAPASDERASVRLQARTGDRETTAHFSAHGIAQWPLRSGPDALVEGHVDLVGVNSAVATNLLSLAGVLRPERQGRPIQPQLAGAATGTIDLRSGADGRIEARTNLEIQDCSFRDPPSGFEWSSPTLSLSAITSHRSDTLRIDSLRLRGQDLGIEATGTVTDLRGEARADLTGFTQCDWHALELHMRSILSEEIRLSGKERRPWHLHGPLRGRSLAQVAGLVEVQIATRLDSVRAGDFEFGPIELTAHCRDGAVQFEPIETPFQGGQVTAQPSVRLVGDLPVLTLAPGRVLDRAVIDPKLCDWLLRYVDPLVATSGSLRGQLSLEIDQLEIPLTRDGARHGSLEGRLLLDGVEFTPGKSLQEIFTTAGIHADSNLQTSHAIAIRLENGRVYHSGLALPIRDGEVTLDGWVGLDRTLSIRVSLPLTEQMLGKDKRLYRLLRGQRIEVPVTGTLDHVRVNEDAFAQNIQRLIQIAVRDSLGNDDPLRGLLRRALR